MSGGRDDAPKPPPADGDPRVIFAVDTSGKTQSLCLRVGEDQTLHPLAAAGRRNARTLVPEAASLCGRHGLELKDVGLVCVATGPGSFTGLRTGVTFAKTLAFGIAAAGGRCDAVGVPAHHAAARLVFGPAAGGPDPPGTVLHAVTDALRGDLYETRFVARERGETPDAAPVRLVAADAFAPDGTVLTGDDAATSAATVLAAGLAAWRAGRRDDPLALVPLYVRRSSAEEKADGGRGR